LLKGESSCLSSASIAPRNSLTAEQKAKLAPLLIDALMRQEVDPVTEAGKEGTLCVFNEIATHN
jgi:hypothetical protein